MRMLCMKFPEMVVLSEPASTLTPVATSEMSQFLMVQLGDRSSVMAYFMLAAMLCATSEASVLSMI